MSSHRTLKAPWGPSPVGAAGWREGRKEAGGRRLEEAAAANQGRTEALTGGLGETERGSRGIWDELEEASCAVGAEGGCSV